MEGELNIFHDNVQSHCPVVRLKWDPPPTPILPSRTPIQSQTLINFTFILLPSSRSLISTASVTKMKRMELWHKQKRSRRRWRQWGNAWHVESQVSLKWRKHCWIGLFGPEVIYLHWLLWPPRIQIHVILSVTGWRCTAGRWTRPISCIRPLWSASATGCKRFLISRRVRWHPCP